MSMRFFISCFFLTMIFGCGGGSSSPETPPTIKEVGVYQQAQESYDINMQSATSPSGGTTNTQGVVGSNQGSGNIQIDNKVYIPLHRVGPEQDTSTLRVRLQSGLNTMYGFYVSIHAFDPEADIISLQVEHYRDGSPTPAYVDTVDLPEQSTSNRLYWDAAYLIDRPGDWRTSFMLIDERGNHSNKYMLYTTFSR